MALCLQFAPSCSLHPAHWFDLSQGSQTYLATEHLLRPKRQRQAARAVRRARASRHQLYASSAAVSKCSIIAVGVWGASEVMRCCAGSPTKANTAPAPQVAPTVSARIATRRESRKASFGSE